MMDMLCSDALPNVRGKYRYNSPLSEINWFRVGGVADVMFRPADTQDLALFLQELPDNIPVTILGVGSNVIVNDAGIRGVVIRLGRGFSDIEADGQTVTVGAGALDSNVAKYCQMQGIGGLEFLVGIPGTIGGALAMNAGAYGTEIADIFVEAEAVDRAGEIHRILPEKMGFGYRSNHVPEEWIFTRAILKGKPEEPLVIAERMQTIIRERESTQPVRERTSGSTFTNPDPELSGGKKAWQLIDEAGCRGLEMGGAKVSEKHCNFLINTGAATAADIVGLGEEVRRRVKEMSGVELHWEIKRL